MNRTLVLSASMALNCALLVDILWLHHRQFEQLDRIAARAPVPPPASPPSFHWSQLESADYAAYIGNLRGIGCPEQTVREIIAADLDDFFAPSRKPLQAKLADPGAAPSERSLAESELTQLRDEQAALFRKLFGILEPSSGTKPAQASSVPPPRVGPSLPEAAEAPPTLPLAFQWTDPVPLGLTEEELQAIDRVRQTFVADLGTNKDVTSPDYLRRWQRAQLQADNLLGFLLGRQALLKYEMAADRQAGTTTADADGR